jgi:DNA-binding phage protein
MNMQAQRKRPSHSGHSQNVYPETPSSEGAKVDLFKIAIAMKKIAIPDDFIVQAVRYAFDYDGIFDLMKLWKNETDASERQEILADIQDMIDACQQTNAKIDSPYIKFNDLDSISKNIRAFKDSLLEIVMNRGGISHLSELTGIPQPSLSRFFNSGAMPHRSTLLKIAKALDLDQIKVELLWTK